MTAQGGTHLARPPCEQTEGEVLVVCTEELESDYNKGRAEGMEALRRKCGEVRWV